MIVLDTILSAALLSATRILAQMLRTLKNMRRNPHSRRALIYARGSDAAGLLSSIQSGASALRVVGIVVPSKHMPLGLLGGVETFDGSGDLQAIIVQTRAEMVLLGSRLSGRTIREVSEVCRQAGVEAHVVPSVEEIPAGRFQLRLREITIDDLLRREPNQLDLQEIRESLAGRVVLVTKRGRKHRIRSLQAAAQFCAVQNRHAGSVRVRNISAGAGISGAATIGVDGRCHPWNS